MSVVLSRVTVALLLLVSVGGIAALPSPAEATVTQGVAGVIVGTNGPLDHVYVHAWKNRNTTNCGFPASPNAFPAGKGAYTAADGSFSISLPAGTYAVSVSPDPDSGYYYGRWYGGGFFPSYRPDQSYLPDACHVDPIGVSIKDTGQNAYKVVAGKQTQLGSLQLDLGGLFAGRIKPYKAGYSADRVYGADGVHSVSLTNRLTQEEVPHTYNETFPAKSGDYQTDIVLPPGLAEVWVVASNAHEHTIGGSAFVTIQPGKVISESFIKAPVRPDRRLQILGGSHVGQIASVTEATWTHPVSIYYSWDVQGSRGFHRPSYRVRRSDVGRRLKVNLDVESVGRWDFGRNLRQPKKVGK